MIFETVAQLKLATLTAGQLVSTKGYYASGDGGEADYIVAATQAVDGYGDHALAGGTVALLQVDASIDVKQYGVAGVSPNADRLALQAAFNALSDGDTIIISVDCSIENATGAGGDPVTQRADAVSSSTLYAVSSATNNITVVITGTVTATSLLDDLFRFTGKKVLVKGPGSVVGSGSTLDTNSADPLLQWRPSLIKLSGAGSICTQVKFVDPHTVGLYLAGSELGASQNYFEGGSATHGAGTILFGIESGVSSFGDTGNIIVGNNFSESAGGKNVYSAIFSTAGHSVMSDNVISDTLEHGIYDYGSYNKISGNSIADIDIAAAIQSFGRAGTVVTENTIKDCGFGGIAMSGGLKSVVANNVLDNVGLSGISWRKYIADANTANYTDISIENNIINHSGSQSAIDFALECNAYRININNNQVFSTGSDVTYGPVRIHVTSAASLGGFDLTFSNNTIYGSKIYGGQFDGFSGFKVKSNTWMELNQTASNVAVRMFNMTHGDFKGNTVKDDRGTKLTSRILFADSSGGNSNINVADNTGHGLLATTDAIFVGPDSDGRYRGNSIDYDTAFGVFTVAASATTVVSNATLRAYGGNQVILTPVNKAAVDIQNSSQALYVIATAIGTFTASTSDGTALVAATAKYAYEIVN